MSWIDKLEQRVGLRPAPEPERPLTPSERADVAEMSNEAVALVQGLLQQFPELAKSPDVRALHQFVERCASNLGGTYHAVIGGEAHVCVVPALFYVADDGSLSRRDPNQPALPGMVDQDGIQ